VAFFLHIRRLYDYGTFPKKMNAFVKNE